MHAAFFHREEARTLVLLLKYKAYNEASVALAAAMARSYPWPEYDCLSPVPLHRQRERMRGANQALVLAKAVSDLTGTPVLEALTRVRRTTPQTKLVVKDRQTNVLNAFEPCADVRGKRVLLVDDVRTTGATARACAIALRKAGAIKVSLLTATVAGYGKGAERTGE